MPYADEIRMAQLTYDQTTIIADLIRTNEPLSAYGWSINSCLFDGESHLCWNGPLCKLCCLFPDSTFGVLFNKPIDFFPHQDCQPCWLGNESLFHWTEQYEQFQVLIGTWLGYGLSHLFIFTVAAAVTGSNWISAFYMYDWFVAFDRSPSQINQTWNWKKVL